MADDVLLGKTSTIERCVERVHEEYGGDPENLFENITRQDAIILNIQRATQAAIDLAMHLTRIHRLGVPEESREAFTLLIEAGFLDKELGAHLIAMVGFRNIAVHAYQDLNLDIVQSIIERHLDDLLRFSKAVLVSNGFRESR